MSLLCTFSTTVIHEAITPFLHISGKRTKNFTKSGLICQLYQHIMYDWVFAMSFKVEEEDVFPETPARWMRPQLQQIDLPGSENIQAFIE
jgi:hypothetical protein